MQWGISQVCKNEEVKSTRFFEVSVVLKADILFRLFLLTNKR